MRAAEGAVRELVRRETVLPDLGLVLDGARRSTAFGRPTTLERLRYKPGTSILAAVRDERGARHWVASYASAGKLGKIARRLEQSGAAPVLLTEHLLAAPAHTDRALAPILEGLFGSDAHRFVGARVLRYNPQRRMVLRGDGAVLKVAAAEVPTRAATALAGRGLPVLAPRRVREGVTATPWWGATDLARRPLPELERHAGAVLAEIHQVPAEGLAEPGPDPADTAAEAATAIAGILPRLRTRAERVAGRIAGRSGFRSAVLVHGDWSPDQVLTDGRDIRIIDFDRVSVAPAERDLGSYLAAGGSEAMLDGYLQAGGQIDADGLAVWRTLATLQRAVEPFRTGAADWPQRVESALAEAELAESARTAVAGAALHRTGAPAVFRAPAIAAAPGAVDIARLPAAVRLDGREWTVERVWPPRGSDPRVPMELHGDGVVRGAYGHPEDEISLVTAGDDTGLPALADVARHGRLVSHRPGKRAVVRLDDGSAFAKVVAPRRADRVARAHARGSGFAAALRVPAIVPHSFAADQVVCFTPLSGRTLHDIGADSADPDPRWVEAWSAWETAWPDCVRTDAEDLPAHGVDEEAAVIGSAVRRAAECVDEKLASRLFVAADLLVRRLGEQAAPPEVLAHRDLHDKQLLWHDRDGLGLLDLDTSARADPGLDLGNLAAHAELAVRQRRWSARRAETALAAIGRVAAGLGVAPARLDAWRRAAAFRVACVHLLRPRGRDQARAELRRFAAEAVREDIETWEAER